MNNDNTQEVPTIRVEWEALLDAVRGPTVDDESLRPYLWIDTGQITCPMLMGALQTQELLEAKRILPIPVWDAAGSIRLRVEFANGLCDGSVAKEALKALKNPKPFDAFDAILKCVPIEAARWRDEERLAATALICDWLHQAGYEPDPPANMERRILEFPLRRS